LAAALMRKNKSLNVCSNSGYNMMGKEPEFNSFLNRLSDYLAALPLLKNNNIQNILFWLYEN